MIKPWPLLSSKKLGDYRIFKLRADTTRSPRTGAEHTFFVIETNAWINIIPLTPEGNVILVRQYRHGNQKITLEVPGGLVEDGEDPSHTALRELQEETGYAVDNIVEIGRNAPNPAVFNNVCYTYLATGARQVSQPQFDGAEDIEVVEVPLADIHPMIARGEISHSLTITAFYFLDHHNRHK